MRPYKKRSFYSQSQNNDNMETENSDDSEKQASLPEDAEKEKDKDRDGVIKNRKKWKRKISRKQFRHHDIKLFTPGEYRSSTFLKQKDSNPAQLKKPEVPSKESITEAIVNSLSGAQKQTFPQKSVPTGEAADSALSKNDVEENNNTNSMQNNNNIGKHQLPAIIMETPTTRRRSFENVHTTIPKQAFAQNIDQNTNKSFRKKMPGDMPSLHQQDATEENNSNITSSRRDVLNEVAASRPIQDSGVDTNSRPHLGNNALSANNNADPRVQSLARRKRSREEMIPEKAHVFLTQHQNHHVHHMGQGLQTSEAMETNTSVEQPENLSLKRRCSVDAPVDLSKKNPSNQQIHQTTFQKDHKVPLTTNGYQEHATKAPPTRASYIQPSVIEQVRAVTRNVFEKPSSTIRPETNSYKSSEYTQNKMKAVDVQKNYMDDFARISKNSIRTQPMDTTKPPAPYRKESPPHLDHLQTIAQNPIMETMVKVTNITKWKDILQHLLKQQFNTQVLNIMAHAYQQLDLVKEEPYIPLEVRLKAQRVLAETYNFISEKLKQMGLNLNAIEVIKILGQSGGNAEKNALQNNLEDIQHLRNLNLNDCPPRQIPTSTHQFIAPQNPQNKHNMPSSFRELPKTPPSPYMPNFAPSRHPNTNAEQTFFRAADMPSSARGHDEAHMQSPLEGNEQQYVSMRSHRRHQAKISEPLVPPVSQSFANLDSSTPMSYPREVPVIPHPNPYDLATEAYNTHLAVTTRHYNAAGRPRSKSHRNAEAARAQHQLKRSMSNPIEKNHSLGYPYMNLNGIPIIQVPTSLNPYFFPQNSMPHNLLQNGDLSITPSNVAQKPIEPPSYPEVYPQNLPKEASYSNAFPEYLKKVSVTLPNLHGLALSDTQRLAGNVPQKIQEVPKKPSAPHYTNRKEEKISSTSDHLEVSRIPSNPLQPVYKEKKIIDLRSSKSKEKTKTVPAVIVADTSMQITKELVSREKRTQQDRVQENDVRMTVITSSTGNASSPEENLKQAVDKDQDENDSEFLVWLEKVKNNTKLKSKFLTQMGIIKQEQYLNDCIEIIDSDEENPVVKKIEPMDDIVEVTPVPKETLKEAANPQISFEGKIEPTSAPKLPGPIKIPSPKQSLSKVDYIPPISLPYIHHSDVAKEEPKKTIYSPEIEPISPVSNEATSFTFPEVSTAAKVLPPPLVPINREEKGVVIRGNLTSPTFIQKRKPPSAFGNYPNNNKANRKSAEYPSENTENRRKSLDRPQTAVSPRVAPSGKLCYVRENHMFLRYFDDTQVELFIKNLSSQDEELLRTTGIDPEKIKNSYKHSNFGIDQLGKTEILHLPRDIEFSRKEDLPDVEEFVKESSLVEQFVPKDFAEFYRYVTGFQIIKNKHPVSLQTFLTMYNTNRTTELLRKYLQRRDEESLGVIARVFDQKKMAQPEKPTKISKILRMKAQEFLNCTDNPGILLQIIKHFESGVDTGPCLLALDMIFSNLLKDKKMYFEIVPLQMVERTPDNDRRKWLMDTYEECFKKVVDCLDLDNSKVAMQGLSTAMNLLSMEGKYPMERNSSELENTLPVSKLRSILMKLLSFKQNNTNLINKYTEYLLFDDILFYTWKLLPSLTAKSNPNEIYIMNYLLLLEKLQIYPNNETKYLCESEYGLPPTFDRVLTKRYLNRVWQCIMLWEHTPQTHRQLLIVLLEKVLNNLDKPLLLTDFLMDSLDVGGAVSLLALQGIFTMIQMHNLDYPNIFAKLYSMFEPEIFHTRYKARLFHLSDLFLSSTHLPEMMVAAFVKRLARLALLAPSEDIIIICQFIGNLILRHPGLKCLLHNGSGVSASADPYIMEERDPLKSNAINSSLWELQTLQNHVQPTVANAARFINNPLPSVEWDIGKILDNTGDDIFDKEIKKLSKLIVLQFEHPKDGISLTRGERVSKFWEFI